MCEQNELAILGSQNYSVVKSNVDFPGYICHLLKKQNKSISYGEQHILVEVLLGALMRSQ